MGAATVGLGVTEVTKGKRGRLPSYQVSPRGLWEDHQRSFTAVGGH